MKLFTATFIGILLIGIVSFNVSAQDNSYFVHLTWKAKTFSPLDYPGKNLPVLDGYVWLTADIFNKEGRLENPENFLFYWYVNDDFLWDKQGKGFSEIFYKTSDIFADFYKVKVEILRGDFKQAKTVIIPQVSQEVVIYPEGSEISKSLLTIQDLLNFQIKNYFFSASGSASLGIRWFLDGKEIKGERLDILTLHFPPDIPWGAVYELSAQVTNKDKLAESAISDIVRIVK